MQMKVLKVWYLESKKVLQNKCRLTRTEVGAKTTAGKRNPRIL